MKKWWVLTREAVGSFMEDNCLSRGAAMAFYAVTSLAPIMLIVVAIAGLIFGQDAARNALTGQFKDLMGAQAADLLQSAIENAGEKSSGVLATIIGVITLLLTASGVFGEMQAALNTIWKTGPQKTSPLARLNQSNEPWTFQMRTVRSCLVPRRNQSGSMPSGA